MASSEKAFRTLVKASGPFQLRARKSQFLGFAFPARDREATENALESLKKEYADATHICYAYRLGRKNPILRANDDGEPPHSAGTPILGQIKAYELYDVLVAVVRYYGGTKLGVGGLIQAYRDAAAGCLSEAEIALYIPKIRVELLFGYQTLGQVLAAVEKHQLKVVTREMTLQCRLVLEIPKAELSIVATIFDALPKVRYKQVTD